MIHGMVFVENDSQLLASCRPYPKTGQWLSENSTA